MSADTIIVIYWWLFTLAVVLGAIGCVTLHSLYHSVLSLIVSLTGVAGYFVLLNAEFLAAAQIIIYVGAISVLFIAAILVSQNIMGQEIVQANRLVWPAALAAAVLFLIMVYANIRMVYFFNPAGNWLPSNTQQLGWSLMATYTLPFEIAGLLLFMAMMGAIIIARRERPDQDE